MIGFVFEDVIVSWCRRNATFASHDKRCDLRATIGAPAGGRTAARRCYARGSTTHGLETVVRVLEGVRGLLLLGQDLVLLALCCG
jgi:hypothetical protein